MHQIDTTGNVGGLFVDAVPGVSPGTIVDHSWLNDTQQELCNMITSQGIALVKGTQTQLEAAVASAIAAALAVPPASVKVTATGGTTNYNTGWVDNLNSSGSRYWKDPNGCVNVRIDASWSGSSTNSPAFVFNLPAGYRPSTSNGVGASCAIGATPALAGSVTVGSSGNVTVVFPAAETAAIVYAFFRFHPSD